MAPLSIAFITAPENGQSNVHLALLHHLLSLSPSEAPPLNLYLLCDEPIRKSLASLPKSEYHTFTFHPIRDETLGTDFLDNKDIQRGASDEVRHSPARLSKAGRKAYEVIGGYMGPRPAVYMASYRRVLEILQSIKVDLAAVDVVMCPGLDACRKLGIKHGMVWPQSSLDTCRMGQPRLKCFWGYPAMFSALPYPVPLVLIPLNILLNFVLIYIVAFNPRLRVLEKARREIGLTQSLLVSPKTAAKLPFVLVPSCLEMEYPHVPLPNAVLCGPILIDVPVVSVDQWPDLAAFLDRGRTVYMNMGSLFSYTEDDVRNTLDGILEARLRTESTGSFQVLWKLPQKDLYASMIDELLASASDKDAIRIESWIDPPVLSVLLHRHTAIQIHHGGANSVHEAAYAGVPQIILPQWCDLYDFARRVEVMGHGVYTNKSAPGAIGERELAEAVVRVLGAGEEGGRMRRKAREIGEACRAAGGVRRAGETLIEMARTRQNAGVEVHKKSSSTRC